MTHDEIGFLLRNGYTVDEIMQLESSGGSGGSGDADKPGSETPEQPEQPEAAGELEEKPGTEKAPESSEEISKLQKEIEDLKAAMQKQNIKTISTPSIPGADDSTEKILAEFIRPPLEHKEQNNGGK
jgi:hypothetical protein